MRKNNKHDLLNHVRRSGARMCVVPLNPERSYSWASIEDMRSSATHPTLINAVIVGANMIGIL